MPWDPFLIFFLNKVVVGPVNCAWTMRKQCTMSPAQYNPRAWTVRVTVHKPKYTVHFPWTVQEALKKKKCKRKIIRIQTTPKWTTQPTLNRFDPTSFQIFPVFYGFLVFTHNQIGLKAGSQLNRLDRSVRFGF